MRLQDFSVVFKVKRVTSTELLGQCAVKLDKLESVERALNVAHEESFAVARAVRGQA